MDKYISERGIPLRICIIHGSPRRGNTYKATIIFKEELQKYGGVEFTEFFLSRDLPHFCNGCYTCFEVGEEKCPHAEYVQPIVSAIREADGLILTSPVYVLSESAQMKAFLDHLAYVYIPHRPIEEMFSKVAMVISTAAGGGTGEAIKSISRSLRFWGIKRIYKCGFALHAANWDDMKYEKQKKFEGILRKRARMFYNSVQVREHLYTPIFTRIVFSAIRHIISGYSDGALDKEYWRENGWLDGKQRPF